MGSASEVGGTVPESDSSSSMSLAADGGSVAVSAAGIWVDFLGCPRSATSPGSRGRGGHGQSGQSLFARNLPPTGDRHAHNSHLFDRALSQRALSVAFEECIAARAHRDDTREVRAWKLFEDARRRPVRLGPIQAFSS